jgi:dCTP deaminase
MSIKSDKWIRRMALEKGMIEPFTEAQKRDGVISYGLSSYGYDMRVGDEFKIFDGEKERGREGERRGDGETEGRSDGEERQILDPKNFNPQNFRDVKVKGYIDIPPHSFVMARSVEYFRIPRNVLTVTTGKSTYARNGILVNITPFEPEWEGYVTMAISNSTLRPARVYAHEGIAQVLFFESDEVCETSYADRKGKYQKQTVLTPSKI